ncbi:hypothetical protein RchiOBHm_Chr2g0140281 [Rosa chinensis]|uniref:Uncharacterized protein n=1 Tax=Rosa chinensis TaxID=74649 RepID=A0A2P6RXB1_ROSCH|nr:hypothetical protein RchiOBHm_Chr2g0140281 [Rosa chinensis]
MSPQFPNFLVHLVPGFVSLQLPPLQSLSTVAATFSFSQNLIFQVCFSFPGFKA